MIKKSICLLLSLALIISLFPLCVFAEDTVLFYADNKVASRNDIVDVSVNISKNSGAQALGLTVLYDQNCFELISANKPDTLDKTQTIINTSTLGKVVYSVVSINEPIVFSGSILNLSLKVKSNASYGEKILAINVTEVSNGNFEALNYRVSDGTIYINAPKLDAPQNVTIFERFSDALTINWDYVEDATGYNVYANGIKQNIEPVTLPTYTITNLSDNCEYNIRVCSLNYQTESDFSEAVIGKTDTKKCYVVFLIDGDVVFEDIVEYGEPIAPPEAPDKNGSVFVGWRKVDYTYLYNEIVSDFSSITEDLTVSAVYEEDMCTHENTEVRNASVSTCAVQGYTGDTYCLDCGELVATGTELPLAAHHYVSTVTEPTPAAQGYTTHTCSVCGDSYIDTYTDYVGADAPQIVVSSGRAVLGNSINVTIALKNNPGIASAKLKIAYNSEIFTLTNVTDGGILGTSVHKPQMASPYTLSWVNDTATVNFTANGTLATLTFAVDENAQTGNYPITVSYSYDDYDIYNVDVEPIRFAVVNGNIEVTDVIIGDVNGDGKVNNLDRVVLTRYLADWDDYPESAVDMIAADVNCDGKVNNLDRVILTRYLADWDDYTELPYTG